MSLSVAVCATSEAGKPIFPERSPDLPPLLSVSAIMVVVVVLPFEPVIPMIGASEIM